MSDLDLGPDRESHWEIWETEERVKSNSHQSHLGGVGQSQVLMLLSCVPMLWSSW